MKNLPAVALIVLILLFPTLLAAQVPFVTPEDEAPDSLLEIDFGSDAVDLLIIGSWEASLLGGLGYRSIPGAPGLYRLPFQASAAG